MSSVVRTQTKVVSKKAKCADNQDLVDRLAEKRSNLAPGKGGHYALSLKRAMESLAKEKVPVTSYEQAMKIQYIGEHTAHFLFPNRVTEEARARDASLSPMAPQRKPKSRKAAPSSPSSVATSVSTKPAKRARQTTTTTHTAVAERPNLKQRAYDKAVGASTQWKSIDLEWKVVLVIDERERKESQNMQIKFLSSGLPYDIRTLPVGDMMWVAQGRPMGKSSHAPVVELLLGTMIERKTLADLVSSIHGTRYDAQRLRMRETGLPQLVLLVEGDIYADARKETEKCHTAIWETRLHMGFSAVQTANMDDTIRLLKRMHRRILQRTFPTAFRAEALPAFNGPDAVGRFANASASTDSQRRYRRTRLESLMELTFDTEPVPPLGMERFLTFDELVAKCALDKAKQQTVSVFHRAMLKQIPRIETVKVNAITTAYPTPNLLFGAFDTLDDEAAKRNMVADLPTRDPTKAVRTCTVGPSSAKNVYVAYGMSKKASRRPSYDQLVSNVQSQQKLSQESSTSASTRQPVTSQLSQESLNSLDQVSGPSGRAIVERRRLSGSASGRATAGFDPPENNAACLDLTISDNEEEDRKLPAHPASEPKAAPEEDQSDYDFSPVKNPVAAPVQALGDGDPTPCRKLAPKLIPIAAAAESPPLEEDMSDYEFSPVRNPAVASLPRTTAAMILENVSSPVVDMDSELALLLSAEYNPDGTVKRYSTSSLERPAPGPSTSMCDDSDSDDSLLRRYGLSDGGVKYVSAAQTAREVSIEDNAQQTGEIRARPGQTGRAAAGIDSSDDEALLAHSALRDSDARLNAVKPVGKRRGKPAARLTNLASSESSDSEVLFGNAERHRKPTVRKKAAAAAPTEVIEID